MKNFLFLATIAILTFASCRTQEENIVHNENIEWVADVKSMCDSGSVINDTLIKSYRSYCDMFPNEKLSMSEVQAKTTKTYFANRWNMAREMSLDSPLKRFACDYIPEGKMRIVLSKDQCRAAIIYSPISVPDKKPRYNFLGFKFVEGQWRVDGSCENTQERIFYDQVLDQNEANAKLDELISHRLGLLDELDSLNEGVIMPVVLENDVGIMDFISLNINYEVEVDINDIKQTPRITYSDNFSGICLSEPNMRKAQFSNYLTGFRIVNGLKKGMNKLTVKVAPKSLEKSPLKIVIRKLVKPNESVTVYTFDKMIADSEVFSETFTN